jgi:cell division protein FtsW (lipid II flippase)
VTLVSCAFCAFALRGDPARDRLSDPFAKRLAAGITALVCGQAAINMAAAIGARR